MKNRYVKSHETSNSPYRLVHETEHHFWENMENVPEDPTKSMFYFWFCDQMIAGEIPMNDVNQLTYVMVDTNSADWIPEIKLSEYHEVFGFFS